VMVSAAGRWCRWSPGRGSRRAAKADRPGPLIMKTIFSKLPGMGIGPEADAAFGGLAPRSVRPAERFSDESTGLRRPQQLGYANFGPDSGGFCQWRL
jgi:hypothetical protein